jgi:hypothetical protein
MISKKIICPIVVNIFLYFSLIQSIPNEFIKKNVTNFTLNYIVKERINSQKPGQFKWPGINLDFILKNTLSEQETYMLRTFVDAFIKAKDIFLANETIYNAFKLAMSIISLKQFSDTFSDDKFPAVVNYIDDNLQNVCNNKIYCPAGFWTVNYEFSEEFPYVFHFAQLVSTKWFLPAAGVLSALTVGAYVFYKLFKRF